MDFSIYLPVAGLSVNALIILAVGATVGFLSGMFGVGGGFLITPLLMFLGIPPLVAVATGANQAVATSVAGAVAQWQRGNVDVRMAAVLLLGGTAGTVAGIQAVQELRRLGQFELTVGLSYVILLGVVGILMLIESLNAMRRAAKGGGSRRPGQHAWMHGLPLKVRFRRSKLYISAIPPVVIGAFVGVMSAIMGVGGGFLLVPAMVYLLRMRTSHAVGTSQLFITFASGLTTVLQAAFNYSVDVLLAVILMAGGVAGAQAGVRVGHALKGEQLRALLALLVLAICARVAVELIRKPEDVFALGIALP